MNENFNFDDEKSVPEDNVFSDLDDILNLSEDNASLSEIDFGNLSGEEDAKQVQEDSGLDFLTDETASDMDAQVPLSEEVKETDFNSEWDFLSGTETETTSLSEESEEAKELAENVSTGLADEDTSLNEPEAVSEAAELEAPDNRGYFESNEELHSATVEADDLSSIEMADIQAEDPLPAFEEADDNFHEVLEQEGESSNKAFDSISEESLPTLVEDASEADIELESAERMAFSATEVFQSPFSESEEEQNSENSIAPIEAGAVALEEDNAPDYQDYSDMLGQEAVNIAESADNPNYVKWYSGSSYDEYFEVSKTSQSTILQGDAYRHSIHVNVGYDTYGWQVQFDNQTVMNLRDVREYQLRNGKLPSENGVISYGSIRTEFQSIDRIVVYESVQYFSYGV